MGQKKLIRFAEIETFEHVFQNPEGMQGQWKNFFKNENPITLELACGKGEYTVGLAELYPERNFIGVDIKGNRIWVGAKKSLQKGLKNVAFLRTQIEQITNSFGPQEVDQIWITFPDPQLRFSKHKKRLTHPRFLRQYQQITTPDCRFHLKTDSPNLYRFTKTVLEMYDCTIHTDMDNVYKNENLSEELKIKTHYESLDIAGNNRIHYLCFSLPAVLAGPEKDNELKEAIKEEELKNENESFSA